MESQYLLSDEFVQFSEKIRELHKTKSDMSEAFKLALADYKKNVKEIEEKALELQKEFDEWKERKTAEATKQP